MTLDPEVFVRLRGKIPSTPRLRGKIPSTPGWERHNIPACGARLTRRAPASTGLRTQCATLSAAHFGNALLRSTYYPCPL